MAGVMVDLNMVQTGRAIAGRARDAEVLRADLLALGLPWPVVELLIGGEIVRRTNR